MSASDTTDNIKKSRSSRSSGTRDKSEENPDDSIVDPICPEVYIGNTTKPRIKGTRLTSTCLVSQCLAKGPEIYIDDTDDLTLPYYDFITVEDALADSTLSAGTRFDMTTNATSRINIQYGSWGTPESQIPDNCSEKWTECDRWLEQSDYWPSIDRTGLVMFDVEHWNESSIDRMVRDGKKIGVCKNFVSAFTMTAINGVMLTIRVNFNGSTCEGREIPPKVKAVLENPLIHKQMFGVLGDVESLKMMKIHVQNWADTGRILVGADPQPDKQDPKSGKVYAADWHRSPVNFHYAGRATNSIRVAKVVTSSRTSSSTGQRTCTSTTSTTVMSRGPPYSESRRKPYSPGEVHNRRMYSVGSIFGTTFTEAWVV